MLPIRILTTTAILLLLAAAGWAQPPTFARADYPTSDAPRGIATGDFNRDGAMDLALVNTGRKSVVVLMNEIGQGRGLVQRYEIVLGGGPFEVATGDLNNDAVLDLVVANADLNTIDIVLGRIAGGFETAGHLAAAGFPRGVAVADLDVDIWFLADPTLTYKLWVRLKAENDSWANDSIFVQFAGGALSGGRTRYAIGTTDALDINLEECSGCGVSGWGWRDERWGSTRTSPPVLLRFPNAGWQRMRVQTREDGVSFDQVVFSAEKYLSAPPGPAKRDNTIVPPNPPR